MAWINLGRRTMTASEVVLHSPSTRKLVHVVLEAANGHDPVDAIDDVELALEILKGRLQRLQDDHEGVQRLPRSRPATRRMLRSADDLRHTCNDGDGPHFGRRTAGCPRCDELTAGAAPREWSGSRRRYS